MATVFDVKLKMQIELVQILYKVIVARETRSHFVMQRFLLKCLGFKAQLKTC